MKIHIKGLTFVGIVLVAAGIVMAFFLQDMADNALMRNTPRYRSELPVVRATDITQAPQCQGNYDKKWVGCQSLAQ